MIIKIILSLLAGIAFWFVVVYLWDKTDERKEKEEMVSCSTCNCLLYKKDAQEVGGGFSDNRYLDGRSFYCRIHKKNYQRTEMTVHYEQDNVFSKLTTRYFKEIEVNENGEPIGYKKIKNFSKSKQ